MSHTPGPWYAKKVADGYDIESASSVITRTTTQEAYEDYESNETEDKSNAELIALAPDMITFINMIADFPLYGDIEQGDDDAHETLNNLIERAKGFS